MAGDQNRATDAACRELLDHVLQDERAWMDRMAPGGIPVPALARLVGRGASPRPLRVQWLSLLGDVLWDVFSDNHDVVGPSGETFSLGSFRSSGGFIADVLNARLAEEDGSEHGGTEAPRWERGPFDYIDFYMGTAGMLGEGPDGPGARPFYVHVFERLRERGCDWFYASPRISIVRFPAVEPADDPASYDPATAIAAEAERSEQEAELDRMARSLDAANAEAFERSGRNPPLVVQAYVDVYGVRPRYTER